MNPPGPDDSLRQTNNAGPVIELIEIERAQIGSEIHDGVLPLIFAASAATSSLQRDDSLSEEQRTRLEQIVNWLAQAMQVTRQTLTNIYPPELSGVPWSKAAEDSLSRSLTESATRLHWDVAATAQTASTDVSLTAYRIAVEAVRNAVAHGKAEDVWIKAQVCDTEIILTVKDNGCGFEFDQVAQDRFGIRSMRARARLVGGTTDIDSQPGQGTTVTAKLPNTLGA